MRNIRWIMWLTLSCSHSSCLDRKERLISATESSLSSTLSDTEFSDSDWLSPESSTVIKVWPLHARITLMLLLHRVIGTLLYGFLWWHTLWLLDHCNDPHKHWLYFFLWKASDKSTYMVLQQTVVVVSDLMQTAWHQPMSWRGQQRGCRRCSGCCCPGQSSHWGSTLIPSKIPALRNNADTTTKWQWDKLQHLSMYSHTRSPS